MEISQIKNSLEITQVAAHSFIAAITSGLLSEKSASVKALLPIIITGFSSSSVFFGIVFHIGNKFKIQIYKF